MSLHGGEPDPEAARTIAKIRRLMLVSLALTGAATAAVFALIGYRVSRTDDGAVSREATIVVPKGARIVGATFGEQGLVVTLQDDSGLELRVHHPRSLRLERRIRVMPEL